jgi:hypothetical protein
MISGGEALTEGVRKIFRAFFRVSQVLFFLCLVAIWIPACMREDAASEPRQSIPGAKSETASAMREDTDLKVFIAFLQDVLKADRSNLPALGEGVDFGEYTEHYKVITDFYGDMADIVRQTRQDLDGQVGSWEKLWHSSAEEQKRLIGYWQERLWEADARMAQALARAEARRADLCLPEVLEPVYAEVFDGYVRQPRGKIAQAVRLVSEAHDKIMVFSDFVAKHPGQIRINGGRYDIDPELRQTLRKLGRDYKEATGRAREVYLARNFPYVFTEILP